MQHELFEELEAFCPKWQAAYPTLYSAARAAGVTELYADYLKTKAARPRARGELNVPDYLNESLR
jgi:hypothetical protein